MDRWALIETAGVGSLIGGVWAKWGPEWAAMAFGLLLIGLSGLRAWNGRKG